MSERNTRPAELQAEPAAPADTRTAGQMLRQLREEAGISAAQVASGLKVTLHKIEALEADRYDELPDLTFARGLASAIVRAFGLDPAPILARMPRPPVGLGAPHHSINQPFSPSSPAHTAVAASMAKKPLLWLAALLLLAGALALWLLPTLPIQLSPPVSTTAADPAPAAGAGMVQEPVAAALPAGTAEAASAAASAALPEASAAQAATPAASADADSQQLLVFTATGQTWVAVRNAAGKSILNRTLSEGETVGVSGDLPLSVTVGRRDAVRVTVRGEPFPLRGASSTSVVRFQVK